MAYVHDVMTESVLSVTPDAPLKEVARLLIERRISGMPVVDASGSVVGVISEGDLLVREQGREAIRRGPLARLFGESAETRNLMAKAEARTAGDAMTSPAITVDASTPIEAAAALMIERQVNRLPVVTEGRLVGIVTRADLVRSFARGDEELVEEIRNNVLRRALWLDPDAFTVGVTDGTATIGGSVERRSTAAILAHMVGMVPGILSVESHVTWSLDDRNIEAPGPDYVSPKGPS
jgi:CBS domain-containing protein